MDCSVEIQGIEGPRELKCKKLKDAQPFEPMSFNLAHGDTSAYVVWGGGCRSKAARQESRAEAETREMISVLMNNARSVETAMSVEQIRAAMSYAPGRNTLQGRLAGHADNSQSAVRKVHKQALKPEGKKTRSAWHFYIEDPDETG